MSGLSLSLKVLILFLEAIELAENHPCRMGSDELALDALRRISKIHEMIDSPTRPRLYLVQEPFDREGQE